jgi:hypothetical protein
MYEPNEMMKQHEVPTRMRKLPIAPNGFLVPFFVAWLKDGKHTTYGEGEPDFRVIGQMPTGEGKISYCHRLHRCWLCGEPVGRFSSFVVGPMCTVNRISSEPPSHLDCSLFAARVCPFLTKPRMRRNEKDLPEGGTTAGIPIERNPGVTAVWTTEKYSLVRVHNGVLFNIGEPHSVRWFCEGRYATHGEVMASIDGGLPLLQQMAEKDGPEAVVQLNAMHTQALLLLPLEVH